MATDSCNAISTCLGAIEACTVHYDVDVPLTCPGLGAVAVLRVAHSVGWGCTEGVVVKNVATPVDICSSIVRTATSLRGCSVPVD
jgi:hypothetical protein